MGIIITAVAVFETKAEIAAVAIINPNISLPGEKPITFIIFIAILLCKFHLCIERAIKNPPIYKNIISLA